jgi:hypothetical protein
MIRLVIMAFAILYVLRSSADVANWNPADFNPFYFRSSV